jgi:hypothetical protein
MMKSLPANRAVSAIVVSAMLASVVACGGKKSSKAGSVDSAGVGDLVAVEGTLSLRGGTPHTILMLEREDGGVVVIQSNEFQVELKSLSGMKVSIEGNVLPSIDGETPLVNATSYKLLALPSGEVPIVGTLRTEGDNCLLSATDGDLYVIVGEFARVLVDFDGKKVWVVGTESTKAYPDAPRGAAPLEVTGYGVLSQR